MADLRMETLTGCPDEAMLAIAEISALARWKDAELRSGSLSIRELIRRGDQIEQQLKQRAAPHHHVAHHHSTPQRQLVELVEQSPPLNASVGIPPMMVGMSSLPSGSGSVSVSPTASTSGAPGYAEASKLAADIFRETAVLYLHTVLSDSHPGKLCAVVLMYQ